MVIFWWFFLAFVLFLDCTSSLVSQFLSPSFSAWISLHRLVPVIQAFLAIVFCLSFQSNIFVALFIHPLSYLIVISTAICGTLTIVWIQLLYPRLYVVLLLLCSQFFKSNIVYVLLSLLYSQIFISIVRCGLTIVLSNCYIHVCLLCCHFLDSWSEGVCTPFLFYHTSWVLLRHGWWASKFNTLLVFSDCFGWQYCTFSTCRYVIMCRWKSAFQEHPCDLQIPQSTQPAQISNVLSYPCFFRQFVLTSNDSPRLIASSIKSAG